MDFLEVPRSLISEETFNYSLPRACFMCNADFELAKEFDRNKLTLEKVEFGKRNVRSDPIFFFFFSELFLVINISLFLVIVVCSIVLCLKHHMQYWRRTSKVRARINIILQISLIELTKPKLKSMVRVI